MALYPMNETPAIDPKAFLLFGLSHFGLQVEQEVGNMVHLEMGYVVEVEGPSLYKLLQYGQVIGPFNEVSSLCEFILEDRKHS